MKTKLDYLTEDLGHALARLALIAEIIEIVDNRCAAADGPVSNTRDEITDQEMRSIYRLAKAKRES